MKGQSRLRRNSESLSRPLRTGSPIKTAEEFGVPLKTVENWVTAYNKDPHCFDDDYISTEQQLEAARKTIKKQKETIEILKKAIAFFMNEKTGDSDS